MIAIRHRLLRQGLRRSWRAAMEVDDDGQPVPGEPGDQILDGGSVGPSAVALVDPETQPALLVERQADRRRAPPRQHGSEYFVGRCAAIGCVEDALPLDAGVLRPGEVVPQQPDGSAVAPDDLCPRDADSIDTPRFP